MGFGSTGVKVNHSDFYGVDVDKVQDYIDQIKAITLKDAVDELEKQTKYLFESFRDGWVGQAEQNFETNFDVAVKAVIKSLNDAYTGLVSEINQIGQGWIDQDAGMVKVEGGK